MTKLLQRIKRLKENGSIDERSAAAIEAEFAQDLLKARAQRKTQALLASTLLGLLLIALAFESLSDSWKQLGRLTRTIIIFIPLIFSGILAVAASIKPRPVLRECAGAFNSITLFICLCTTYYIWDYAPLEKNIAPIFFLLALPAALALKSALSTTALAIAVFSMSLKKPTMFGNYNLEFLGIFAAIVLAASFFYLRKKTEIFMLPVVVAAVFFPIAFVVAIDGYIHSPYASQAILISIYATILAATPTKSRLYICMRSIALIAMVFAATSIKHTGKPHIDIVAVCILSTIFLVWVLATLRNYLKGLKAEQILSLLTPASLVVYLGINVELHICAYILMFLLAIFPAYIVSLKSLLRPELCASIIAVIILASRILIETNEYKLVPFSVLAVGGILIFGGAAFAMKGGGK